VRRLKIKGEAIIRIKAMNKVSVRQCYTILCMPHSDNRCVAYTVWCNTLSDRTNIPATVSVCCAT